MRRAGMYFIVQVVLAACIHIHCTAQTSQNDQTLFRLAQQYERGGDYRGAADVYERLHLRDPDDFTYFDGYRRMLMQLRRFDEAIGITETRYRQNPRDVNLAAILGGMYYQAEEREHAFDIWEGILEQEPRNMVAYQQVATRMIDNRLLDEAIGVYLTGRKRIGQRHLFANDLAFLHAATMNYGDATREYLLLLEQTPQQLSFIQSRMSMYVLRNGGLAEAIEAAEAAAAEHRQRLQFQRLLAWLYREAGDFDDAYEVYRRIDNIENARGAEIFTFAQTAFREREYEAAARAYRDILDMHPDFERISDVRFGYARCLEGIGEARDSVEYAVYPVSPPAETGRVSEMRAVYGAVVDEYRAIVEDFPGSSVSALALLRIAYIQYHRYFDLDGAVETLERVVDRYPGGYVHKEARAMLGEILIVGGSFDEAIAQFNALAGDGSPNEDFADRAVLRKAEISFYRGDFDETLELLRELVHKSHSSFANNAIELQTFILENRAPAIRGVQSDEALEQYARAMHQKRRQRYSEAIAMLRDVIDEYPKALLVDDALLAVGDLYFAMQRYDDALAWYDRLKTHELIPGSGSQSILRDLALLRIAEVHQYGTGDRERAIRAYEDLIAEHPRSMYAADARKRIRLLRGDPS
jgi:tetratricopeptide (TPR) repeat protein